MVVKFGSIEKNSVHRIKKTFPKLKFLGIKSLEKSLKLKDFKMRFQKVFVPIVLVSKPTSTEKRRGAEKV